MKETSLEALKREITRHRHVMAGKRMANERLAERAVHHHGYYRNFCSEIPGHPGYGCLVIFPKREEE